MRYVHIHSHRSNVVWLAVFPSGPFAVAFDEVARFLRSLGHNEEIIQALRKFEHKAWLDPRSQQAADGEKTSIVNVTPLRSDADVAADGGAYRARIALAPWQRSLDLLHDYCLRNGPFDAVTGHAVLCRVCRRADPTNCRFRKQASHKALIWH